MIFIYFSSEYTVQIRTDFAALAVFVSLSSLEYHMVIVHALIGFCSYATLAGLSALTSFRLIVCQVSGLY
jgi:hypothetical protein